MDPALCGHTTGDGEPTISQIHNYGERRWFVKIETPSITGGVFYLYLYLSIMKYKITDSKLESVVFLYLDNQDFVTMEYGTYEYFLNSENDEYAQIKFSERSRWCTIERKLMVEIASFFSLEYHDAMSFIARWVESKIGLEFNTIESQSDIIVRYFK